MPEASPTRPAGQNADPSAAPVNPPIPNPPLNAPPEIEHLFQVSLFLLIVTGFGALAATGKLDPISLVCVFAALLLRGVLLLRERPFAISRRITSRLAVAYLLIFLADFFLFSGRDFVTPAVHLVLFGMCVKLFSVERDRDYTYLALLAFLMVLSAAILTVDSTFLATFAVFLVLAVFWFMATELRRSALAASNTAPLAIPGLRKRRRAISPLHRLAVSLARATVVLVAAILAAASVLFFTIPRLGGGYISRHTPTDAVSIGYSDTVDLGVIGRIQQSSDVVAHIHIEGDTTGDRLIRLRGAALTNFDGHRWSNPQHTADLLSQTGRVFQLTTRASQLQHRDDLQLAHGPQRDLLKYRVLMEPLTTNVIFTIPSAQALYGAFGEIGVDSDLTFHNLDHERAVTLYEGVSDVSVPLPTTLSQLPDLAPAGGADTPAAGADAPAAGADAPAAGAASVAAYPSPPPSDRVAHIRPPLANVGGDLAPAAGAASVAAYPTPPLSAAPPAGPYTSAFAERYLQLPEPLDPRIPELARQLTGSEPTPYLRALAIERYLSTRYAYTLQLPARTPDDPVADFLFSRRRGHCEYFASAMAVMLRSVGIPSRIVNGFRGAQFNQVNATYIVRASNAHSWLEAFIPGAGWVTFDPTPGGSGAAPATLWSRYQLYLDASREFWREWIVNYDAGHQQALSVAAVRQTRSRVSVLRLWSLRQYHRLLGQARRFHRAATHNPQRLLRRMKTLLVLLLLLALPFAAIYLRARWRASSPRISPSSAASILYLRMAKRLARRGYSRAPAQTPSEFAASIPDSSLREAVARFTSAYERARYGNSSDEAAQLPALLDQVRNTLAHPTAKC